ncbi:piggyBac transposable element-derived protein 4-like [Pecten maximus]|uniref:piggyBac transposable element-derived protein 4-like n=1 Tax=Pecten maximus TaxID=6579 RepID=UPI00145885B5|nr:piggyBac transposable element-derived protein 4-like [Pecten maximus]
MADSILSDDLINVLPEFRDLFEEIFNDNDSDEFEGYEMDDVEEIDQPFDAFAEENWRRGRLAETSTFTFTADPGVTLEQNQRTHLDYFKEFVSEDIISTIVQETNRYAADFLASHGTLPVHSRLRKWSPVSNNEMKAFLGMIIAMGLVTQANIQDYWSSDPVVSTPFFGTVMSRDRFLSIMSFLHLSDNNMALQRGQENYSPLQKLGSPYQKILENFERVYTPHQELAID